MGLGLQDLEKEDDFDEMENFNYRKEGVLDAVSCTQSACFHIHLRSDVLESMMRHSGHLRRLKICQDKAFSEDGCGLS